MRGTAQRPSQTALAGSGRCRQRADFFRGGGPTARNCTTIGPAGQMMAAPVTATGTTLEPGTPVALFDTRIYSSGADNGQGRQYDVTRDGRFLINTVLDETAAPITLLLNWKPGSAR